MARLLLIVLLIGMSPFAALAAEPEAAADSQAAATATNNAETAKKSAPAVKPGDEGYEPPPGFQTKKRGQLTLYCMKDRSTGTRFVTEKCYDKDQMREYLLALEIQKRDIDRIRSTCANAATCANQ
jgi:hypothetical protein